MGLCEVQLHLKKIIHDDFLIKLWCWLWLMA